MIGPKDIVNRVDQSNVDSIIESIDAKMQLRAGEYEDRIEVLIYGEASKLTRDKVAELYMRPEVGWSKVTHCTSSEHGERPGLTRFTFYY